MSRQKQLVLQVLQQSEGHMTAQQVYDAAREKLPSISLGTVYRDLSALAGDGAIRRIAFAEGPDFFDRTPEAHDHLVCARCGRVCDLADGDLRAELERRAGVPILSYNLTARYVCAACAAEK